MSDTLSFMMGEFKAEFPTDRLYASNHMWAQPASQQDSHAPAGSERVCFGFTAYAVRLLQDVYFLEWLVDAPCQLKNGQEFGSIESKKAESSLYAPAEGQLIEFNEQLMDDPSAINVDKYGAGWLFQMELPHLEFMTTDEYVDHLAEVWDKTQRTIKGQLNE